MADKKTLYEHVTATYFTLRVGIAAIAAAFPIILWSVGALFGVGLRRSMSAYYYVEHVRDVFVGILFAIGSFLYLYKGYTRLENWLLNLAGICALGIAIFPTSTTDTELFSAHGTFAIGFFVMISFVCWFCSRSSLEQITDAKRKKRYRVLYAVLAAAMVVPPIAVYVLLAIVHALENVVFWLELVAVLSFALYWVVKSFELKATQALERALSTEGKQKRVPALVSSS